MPAPYIFSPSNPDYDDTYQEPLTGDRYNPEVQLTDIDVGEVRWRWLSNKRIVRSALIWFLQSFFAQWPPAFKEYPYKLGQRRGKIAGAVQIVSSFARVETSYPQIVVNSPVEVVRPVGFGDYGSSAILETEGVEEKDEPLIERYESKFEYSCPIDVYGELEEVEEIQSFVRIAFGIRPLRDKFTQFTGGLYIDIATIDCGSVRDYVYGGGTSGQKVFVATVTVGVFSFGGVRYEFLPEVIREIYAHFGRSE